MPTEIFGIFVIMGSTPGLTKGHAIRKLKVIGAGTFSACLFSLTASALVFFFRG